MSQQSRIVELSTRIATNTAKVDAYLTAHSLPTPSLGPGTPFHPPIPPSEATIIAARKAIISDTLELRQQAGGCEGKSHVHGPRFLRGAACARSKYLFLSRLFPQLER
ncbi:hypothetical protein B0H66DRAFT_563299 [Apodospora peruviana]|uniref:Uncharacterized protein n=1 Tax=Apodospora peruviana TaxID=516989 RepID=A0AAE0HXF6_9PEZI|nr:hypothetical protein B0H66DRAFT_563299 [Apodospora peruviana]